MREESGRHEVLPLRMIAVRDDPFLGHPLRLRHRRRNEGEGAGPDTDRLMREEMILQSDLDRDVIRRIAMLPEMEPTAGRQREHIQEAPFVRIQAEEILGAGE